MYFIFLGYIVIYENLLVIWLFTEDVTDSMILQVVIFFESFEIISTLTESEFRLLRNQRSL